MENQKTVTTIYLIVKYVYGDKQILGIFSTKH